MYRVLLTLAAGVLILLFSINNTHHVEMSLIIGAPVHVRLIFLLLTVFLMGHFSAVLANVYFRSKLNSTTKQVGKKEVACETEEDEFFA